MDTDPESAAEVRAVLDAIRNDLASARALLGYAVINANEYGYRQVRTEAVVAIDHIRITERTLAGEFAKLRALVAADGPRITRNDPPSTGGGAGAQEVRQ